MRTTSKPNKQAGPWLAFGEGWFRRHQCALRWLLNTPLVRLWFRWVMCIPACDCPPGVPILEIGPNRFTVAAGAGQLQTTFRTHPKYSKRLYSAFRPLWWLLHFWDWLVADRFAWAGEWSFGFGTLTVYPDPDPEVSTVDGRVSRSWSSGQSFTLLRDGAGNGSEDNGGVANVGLSSHTSTNLYRLLYRGICLFDTSPLTGDVVISSATLSLYGNSKSNGLGETSLDVVASNPASNTALSTADYQALSTTLFGSVNYADFSTSGYNDIALNAAGIENINKTGISKFGARNGWDRSNTPPTWAYWATTDIVYVAAEASGTGNDPKLTVIYGPAINYLNRADTTSLSTSESRAISGTANRSDAAAISISGGRGCFLTSARADAAAVAVAESSQVIAVYVEMSRADAAALNLAEQTNVLVVYAELDGADNAALALAEASALDIIEHVDLVRADTVALTVTNVSTLQKIDALREISTADGIALSVAEVRTLLGLLAQTDAAAAELGEQSALEMIDALRELALADEVALSLAEASTLLRAWERADTTAVAITEASALKKFYLPPPSAAALRVLPWLRPGKQT